MKDHLGYVQIADRLRDELTVPGAFPPGTVIETQHELAARFGVNRTTIERALAILLGEGLLISSRSKGTSVPFPRVPVVVARAISESLDPQRELATLGPWETALRRAGLTGHGRVHAVTRESASEQVAEMLNIPVGAPVVARYRNPTIDGHGPAQIQQAWMPLSLVEDTPLARPGDILGGVYACMTLHGIRPTRFEERISARIGLGPELAVLDRPAGSVVMEVWRTTFADVGGDEVGVEALHIVANASLIQFSYQQTLDDAI